MYKGLGNMEANMKGHEARTIESDSTMGELIKGMETKVKRIENAMSSGGG